MRKLLSEETAEAISSLVVENYPPESKIPTESELAKMFSVSRTTIREAIKLLCSQGVLEIRRGAGTFVRNNTGLVCDPFGMKYMERGKLIKEMGEFSLACQPGFASFAAQRATEEDIAALEDNYRRFSLEWQNFKSNEQQFQEQDKEQQFVHIRQLDVEFHALIRTACHNQVISRVDSIFLEFASIDPVFIHAIEASIYWHPIIIDAIRRRDHTACENAMRRHILSIDEHIASGEAFHPAADDRAAEQP